MKYTNEYREWLAGMMTKDEIVLILRDNDRLYKNLTQAGKMVKDSHGRSVEHYDNYIKWKQLAIATGIMLLALTLAWAIWEVFG